ncbi:MAG: MFS transporter [Xanthomonadales bacterium]|nr:MFS transporter [Xanthomonadales bacterium]
MAVRNLIILTLCQLISATGAIIMITLGGIIGARLASDPALATLPVSIMVLSIAATTIPATLLMRRMGRKRGFAVAALSSTLAAGVAGFALYAESFGLFMLAGACFGINMAFTQQYRYAAAESVEPYQVPRAISIVLLGAIGGALVGPELVRFGQWTFPDVEFLGTLLSLGLLYVVQAGLFLGLGPLRGEGEDTLPHPGRSFKQMLLQPIFLVAVFSGAVAYGVMSFIMTATPLSMHVHDGFSLEQTAQVIRSHVLGMYVPSLFAGLLIQRFGVLAVMWVGGLGLIAACVVGLQGQSYMHYWYALVLLGVGWNFLYVGSTTMVTLSYTLAERFRAQAVNEFAVFGTSAATSLLAGTMIHLYGWTAIVVAPLPLLLAVLVGLFAVRGESRLARQ